MVAARNRPLPFVLVLAVLLRLLVFASFQSEPGLFTTPDTSGYWQLARSLAEERTFSRSTEPDAEPETKRTPGYPLYLSLWLLLVGENERVVVVSQIVLGVMMVWLTWSLAGRVIHPRAAPWAAIFMALSPTQIYYNNLLLTETLFAVTLLGGFYFAWLFIDKRRWIFLAASGLIFGISVLVRPFGILFPLVIIAGLCVELRGEPARLGLATLALLLCFGLVVGGWMARNQVRVGTPLVTTIAGHNLLAYRAAAVQARQTGKTREEVASQLYATLSELEDWQSWDAIQREAAARVLAIRILSEDPWNVLLGSVHSVRGIYLGFESGFYDRLFHRRTEASPLPKSERPLLFAWRLGEKLGWVCAYAFAVAGSVSMFRQRRWSALTLLLLAVAYTGVLNAGTSGAGNRFRMPFEPYIAALAAGGIIACSSRLARWRESSKLLANQGALPPAP